MIKLVLLLLFIYSKTDFMDIGNVESQLYYLTSCFQNLYTDIIDESQKIVDDEIKEGKDFNTKGCIDEHGRETMAKIDEAAQIFITIHEECTKQIKNLQKSTSNQINKLENKLKLDSNYDKYLKKTIYETQKTRNNLIIDFMSKIKKC